MNYLVFNKNCVVNIPSIEGNDTIVRTGGTPFNENDPFTSLVNTLLHSNIKKFSSLPENDRNFKIQKLKGDISMKIKNSEHLKKKIFSFLEVIQENIFKFYEYINSNDFSNFKFDSNKKFYNRLLNDGEHDKIELFKLLSEVIQLNDFKKIFKMTQKKWIADEKYSIVDYNKYLQKETIRYLSYQETFDDIDKKKSDFFLKNIISMVNLLVKISFEQISDDVDFYTNSITKEKIDILSDYLENNIIFVDSKTRLPFFFPEVVNAKIIESRKTIIIISFDLKHFEIIGKHFPDDRIQRSFMSYDNIVKNINNYFNLSNNNKSSNNTEKQSKEEIITITTVPTEKKEEIITITTVPTEKEKPITIPVIQKDVPHIVTNYSPIIEQKVESSLVSSSLLKKDDSSFDNNKDKEDVNIYNKKTIIDLNENIKEKIYYNSDDEILNILGDEKM